jgi:hypothetical protein
MRLRQIALVAVVVAVVPTMLVGTGSFSSVTADRGVSVDTVGDSQAYMALQYSEDDIVLRDSEQYLDEHFLTIGNNFGTPVDASLTSVEVSASDGLSVVTDSVNGEPIGTGDELDVHADLRCQSTGRYSPSIAFDVVVDGSSVHAETTEEREVTFDVRCELFEINVIGSAEHHVGGPPFPRLKLIPGNVNVESASVDADAVSVQSTNPVKLACEEPTNGTETVTVDLEVGSGQTALTTQEDVTVKCTERPEEESKGQEGNNGQ